MFQDCYFSCEYHGGHIALRDLQGLYLAPIGSRAVLKTRSKVVTKDELFSLEDSLPQASFVAASNTRYVSVKQGMLKVCDITSSVPRGLTRRLHPCTQFYVHKIFGCKLHAYSVKKIQLCFTSFLFNFSQRQQNAKEVKPGFTNTSREVQPNKFEILSKMKNSKMI